MHKPQREWKLHIDADMVLRAMGADPRVIRGRQPRLLKRVEAVIADQSEDIRPRVAMREMVVREHASGHLLLEGGIEIRNATVCERLTEAQTIVAIVGTIGGELEKRSRSNDAMSNLILDGMGIAAITALTESIRDDIGTAAQKRGAGATNALFPGMAGWGLAEGQAQIFSIVDASLAGVSLNRSFMMTPQKSVSFLIGIGPGIATGPSVCESCGVAAHCRHSARVYAC